MVQNQINFSRPPVCEGLIDIRIQLQPSEALTQIENLHPQFSSKFPQKQTRYEFSGSFKLEEKNLTADIKHPHPLGYLFLSSDKKKLLQLRRDGFTFNQLKPDPNESWPGWESIKPEAKKLWELYSQALKLAKIERIALRYINKIVIKIKDQNEGIELNDYLTTPPQIPDKLPQVLAHYFSKVEFLYPELKGRGVIIIAPHSENASNAISITLDIEVYRKELLPLDNDLIWSSLDQFRNAKNEIFNASITDKAKELFK